ncbi:hypothetical protein ES703_80660 [subsurface metagenome]
MRRAVARGRILPQSLSTDPRYGRLSLKAQVLYPLLWINCDDQGRLSGDPDEIKYAACPSIREITADEIPDLLEQMETRGMIKVYTTSKTQALQMLDWWEVQRLQWAYPSEYPPPAGWQDSLRYHPTPTEIITENWPPPSRLPSGLPSSLPSELPSNSLASPLTTPFSDKEEEEGNRRGRGILPSSLPGELGSKSPPSPATDIQLYDKFVDCYEKGWGLKTDGKSLAQMRDFSKELAAAGCSVSYVQAAFKEAAGANKLHLSYVRAILLDWLGVARGPPR